jgi:hypothetical protein
LSNKREENKQLIVLYFSANCNRSSAALFMMNACKAASSSHSSVGGRYRKTVLPVCTYPPQCRDGAGAKLLLHYLDNPAGTFTTLVGINEKGVIVDGYTNHAVLLIRCTASSMPPAVMSLWIFRMPHLRCPRTSTSINDRGLLAGFFIDAIGIHGFLGHPGNFVALDHPGTDAGTVPNGLNARRQLTGQWNMNGGICAGSEAFVRRKSEAT